MKRKETQTNRERELREGILTGGSLINLERGHCPAEEEEGDTDQ